MRTFRDRILFNPAIWLPIGLSLACLGGFLVGDIPSSRAASAQLQQLPAVHEAAVGQLAVAEGQVSADAPALEDGFVIVVREVYKSCGRSSCWSEVERASPPFVIAADEGPVRIFNGDYAIETTAVERQDARPSWTSGSRRSRGFVAGSPMVAVGVVAGNDRAFVFEADWVAAGTRAEYLEAQAQYHSRGLRWGGAILGTGLLLTAIGLYQTWRFLREVRKAP